MEALRYDSPGSPSYEPNYSQTQVDSGVQPESSQTQVDFGAQPESSQTQVDSGGQSESRSRKRGDATSPSARPEKRVRFNANLDVQEIPGNTVTEDHPMMDVFNTIEGDDIFVMESEDEEEDPIFLMDTLYDEDDLFVAESDDEDVQESIIIESDGPVVPIVPELSFEEELARLQNQDYGMMTTDEDIWSADA
jgi:hypothetical protein